MHGAGKGAAVVPSQRELSRHGSPSPVREPDTPVPADGGAHAASRPKSAKSFSWMCASAPTSRAAWKRGPRGITSWRGAVSSKRGSVMPGSMRGSAPMGAEGRELPGLRQGPGFEAIAKATLVDTMFQAAECCSGCRSLRCSKSAERASTREPGRHRVGSSEPRWPPERRIEQPSLSLDAMPRFLLWSAIVVGAFAVACDERADTRARMAPQGSSRFEALFCVPQSGNGSGDRSRSECGTNVPNDRLRLQRLGDRTALRAHPLGG